MTETVFLSLAVLLRIFSNPLGNVFQKQLTVKGIEPLFISFLTYFLLSIGCLSVMAFSHWLVLPRQFWIFSVLGGMAGALGNGFLVKALQGGELSVLGPVNSYKSVIGIIGGIILLGEIPHFWGLLGMALIIYGSYFVLDTTKERFTLALLKKSEIQFRIWAMILTAIEAVFVKKVILASSTTLAFVSWCCFGAVFSFILVLVTGIKIKAEAARIGKSETGKFALLVICIGIMQLTTNYTFRHMAVGFGLSLFQLSAIVSVVLGYKFFKEQNIRKKIIGSAIMIIGSVFIILLGNR